jgi:hypothetical protein
MKKMILTAILATLSQPALAEHLEALMGHFTTQGGVHIQVASGGCTWKKQFEVNQINNDGRIRLVFNRKVVDPCRAYIPYGEILTFSFEELGLKAGDVFEIANPDIATRVSRMQ